MLHLIKLCVGVPDIPHLAALQASRLAAGGTLCHRTRNFPRRAAEIVSGGGSLYWVIQGIVAVRQSITAISEDAATSQAQPTRIGLDPVLVPVLGGKMRPFQGWRYLAAEAAPPDFTQPLADAEALPPELLMALRGLCLI